MLKKSLVRQLIVPVSVVVFVAIVAVGTVFSLKYEKEIEENAEFQVSSYHQQIATLLTVVDDLETKRVKSAVMYFREHAAALGTARAGSPVTVGAERTPNILFGGRAQAQSTEVVDQVKSMTGAGATVFSARNGDFIRIATNVKKDDGSRAIGTKLDPAGKAIAALRNRTAFYGVVDILGKPYITAYEPMIDGGGAVIGAWYTGYQLSELTMLEKMIHASRILDDGFTALVDNKGVVRFHSDHVTGGFVDSLLNGSSPDLSSAWSMEKRVFAPWGYTVVTGCSRQEIAAHIDAIRWMITIAVIVAFVMMVGVISWFVQRVIVQPITGVLEKMNNADLNTIVHDGRTDEIGELTGAFDRFVATIRNVLVHVDEAAETIVSSVAEISASAQQMSSGASEQTQQTTDVSAAVDQLMKTVEESSRNAGATADTAHESKTIAEQGGVSVRATVDGMREVSDVVNRTAQTINVLHQASSQIGQIVTVIEEIADQTNLLALNAAIEAARAGDQGRGFAVVADEVRKLAERTTKATREIADTIGAVQTETAHAMEAISEGTGTVERGMSIAEEAGRSLQLIVENSQHLADMVKGMSAVTSEQSEGLSRIGQSIQTISMVTNETAHSSEQVAVAVEHLNGLTVDLHTLVKQFQLRSAEEMRGNRRNGESRTAGRTVSPVAEFMETH